MARVKSKAKKPKAKGKGKTPQRRCRHQVEDESGKLVVTPNPKKCPVCARIRKERSRVADKKMKEALKDVTWVPYYVLLWGIQGVSTTAKRVKAQLTRAASEKVCSPLPVFFFHPSDTRPHRRRS